MSIKEFSRSAGKTIGPMGGAFMTGPKGMSGGADIGLDFFGYYALGRGGVLGDVDGRTVAEAFYFFNPDLASGAWDANKANHDPREVAAHYAQTCAAWGREAFGDVEGLDDFSKLAERVAQAHEPTPSSSLFVGWRDMPLPADAAGRVAVQCVLVLRELRGGAHVEAAKQVGLEPSLAVAINQPQMYQLFGWTGEMPDTTDAKPLAEKAENITDDLVAPAFSALDEAEQDRFGSILAAIATKLGV